MDETVFVARDGETYVIALDHFGEEISVYRGGERVGQIKLRCIAAPDESGRDWYHITHLALEACRGLGIGTRCLQFHKEVNGAILTAGRNDGFRADDGSHLTEDGPGFIAKMRAKGIVAPDLESRHDDRDDD